MRKPMVADAYRVRRDPARSLVSIEFSAREGVFEFVISALGVPALCQTLTKMAAGPAVTEMVPRSAANQSRKRLADAETARQLLADPSLARASAIGIDPEQRRVQASFGLPSGEIVDLFLPPEDARELCDAINRALLLLATNQADSKH